MRHFELMHNAINWSFENNLKVIIDLHVLRSHHFNRPDNRELWEDKSSQECFIKFWHELSSELEKYPNSKLAYEPFLLTHYQAEWTPIKDLNIQVTYPGKLISDESYNKLDEDLSEYVIDRNHTYNKSVMDAEIKQAVDIANKYGLKLYCGEFGASPTTNLAIRVEYYKDLISIFNKYDIALSHWNYKNNFPMVDKDLQPIKEIIQVLIP